jgi:hypothetical protein
MLREWITALALLAWNASSVRAVDLENAWHAPQSCPSGDTADQRLRERNGGVSPLASGIAHVWIDRAASGEFRARISLRSAEGREQRVLYGHDCEALSEAVLLVIGMASEMDDHAPATPHPAEPSATLEPVAPPQEPAPLAAPALPAPKATGLRPGSARELNRPLRQRTWNVRLGPAFTVDRGSLPSTSFAGGGALALGIGRFQATLSVSYFSRHRVRLAPLAGASTEFGLATGELRGCYIAFGDTSSQAREHTAKKYALAPCIALEMGAQRGQGKELARAATQTGVWAAGMLGLSASLGPYGRVSPVGSLSVGVPLRRPRFEVEQAGPIFQANPVFLRATLGLMIEVSP